MIAGRVHCLHTQGHLACVLCRLLVYGRASEAANLGIEKHATADGRESVWESREWVRLPARRACSIMASMQSPSSMSSWEVKESGREVGESTASVVCPRATVCRRWPLAPAHPRPPCGREARPHNGHPPAKPRPAPAASCGRRVGEDSERDRLRTSSGVWLSWMRVPSCRKRI